MSPRSPTCLAAARPQASLFLRHFVVDVGVLVVTLITTASVHAGLDVRRGFFVERDPALSFPFVGSQTVPNRC